MKYRTRGTCSRAINYEVEDGKVVSCSFVGGCDGNTQGVARLVTGMTVDDVIAKLEGIDCRGRGTSCPDQLAKALKEYKQQFPEENVTYNSAAAAATNCDTCPGKEECRA